MFVLLSILVLVALLVVCSGLLMLAAKYFTPQNEELVDQIDKILPQTQCGQCNYPGCRPYATAISKGEADINQCPPGGQEGVVKLADLLGKEPKPLNEAHGTTKEPQVAIIDEEKCIGCTLCIKACPVDAILGAPKVMTSVIAQECTGCDLCVPACPVDCIDMVPAPHEKRKWLVQSQVKN